MSLDSYKQHYSNVLTFDLSFCNITPANMQHNQYWLLQYAASICLWICAHSCCERICICSEETSDERSLNELSSLMNSLTDTVNSRLEQLNKGKEFAGKYEEAFTAASTALTAAQKQQTDANSQYQVFFLQHISISITMND